MNGRWSALSGQSYVSGRFLLNIIISLIFLIAFGRQANAQDSSKVSVGESLTVNGDTVEYFTDKNEVVASGKVVVDYQGTVMRCEKLTVNTKTQDATAEGHVHVVDASGVMEGEKVIYNFKSKKGTILKASFHSGPYFGKTEKIEILSDEHFIATDGYATTCDFDRPHFRLRSKRMDVIANDTVRTRQDTLYLGDEAVLYSPMFNHSLKDSQTHVQVSPGYRKEWGAYMLASTRYSLADDVQGRLYLDYRDRLGLAEGTGINYTGTPVGKGDFKFYYTDENPKKLPAEQQGTFERYFARLRHRWDIDDKTELTGEYFKIGDEKRKQLGSQYAFLKDYFPREYELDSNPLTYVSLTHLFSQSSLDVLVQKRVNNWFTQVEKLPEVKYSMSGLQLGSSPLFFEDITQAAYLYNKLDGAAAVTSRASVDRVDTWNKVSLPQKVSFIDLTPFVAERLTYYSSDRDNGTLDPRTVFYTGTQASTKFYRIYDVKSNFLNMEIEGLRHIITPMISYAYNNDPSVHGSRIVQTDGIDAIGRSNAATLELSNKLQTKRDGKTIDFADLVVSSTYSLYQTDPLTNQTSHDYWSDFLFKFTMVPYSWMNFYADADYNPASDNFSTISYDTSFTVGPEKTIGFGQRYQKSGGDELTLGSDWRLTPKWKFHLFERYQFADVPNVRKGLFLQEYGFSRDLHCWILDFTYTHEKYHGDTLWFIFRLKAFPETMIDFRQGFYSPRSGSQYY